MAASRRDSDAYGDSDGNSSFDEDGTMASQVSPFVVQISEEDLPPTTWRIRESLLQQLVSSRLARMHRVRPEPATHDEVRAIAFHTAKFIDTVSWATPLGMVAGLNRCWAGRASFRLPFYKPDLTRWDMRSFPLGLGWVRGARAVMAHHLLRASLYTLVGSYAAKLVIGPYAISVMTIGLARDPRMAEYNEFVKERVHREGGRVPRPGTADVVQGREQRNGSGHLEYPQSRRLEGLPRRDDANPRGVGAYGDVEPEGDWTGQDAVRDTLHDKGDRSSKSNSTPVWQRRSTSQPRVADVETASAPSPSPEPFSMFDEASPTGGQGMHDDVSGSGRPGSPARESAWDRIRRGERPAPKHSAAPAVSAEGHGASTSRVPRSRENSDSFAFSESEADRSFAKEEAQRDFDARIERERHGKSFGG